MFDPEEFEKWREMLRNDDDHFVAELDTALHRMFPDGFESPEIMQSLAPDGWEKSPLVAVFHPSFEQVYEEAVRIQQNMSMLGRKKDEPPPAPPTRDEVAKLYEQSPLEPELELREIVGKCLWDIISDNHQVFDADGHELDFGSFRFAGGVIADHLNRRLGDRRYDYMSFYMGTAWGSGRADFSAVYRLIFARMKGLGWDWVYHFPRLRLVNLRPLKEALDAEKPQDFEQYDPSAAIEQAQQDEQRDRETAEFQEKLDEDYREAVSDSQDRRPPAVVQAYSDIYDNFPRGWPPVPEED